MASQLPSRPSGRSSQRPTRDVRLTATKPDEATDDKPQSPSALRYGWQLVAVGGALTAALAGWIIVSGLSVVGWLAAALAGSAGDMADAFRAGTSIWLLTNGAPLELGGVHWSLIPLGVSLLTVFMISRFARAAARFAVPWGDDWERLDDADGADADESDDVNDEDDGDDRLGVIGRLLLGIVGLSTVSYAALVAAVGLGTGVEITRGILGAAVIAAAGSAWGASRGLGVRLSDVLPGWARPLPGAVAAGVGILLLSGVAVLVTGIVQHADRIGSLASGLGAGAIGGIALWAAQAAFLPNLVACGASYALGGGFAIGQGSVVAPSDVTLGLLPSFPILGALPSTGAGSSLGLLWLAFGVAAGAVAAGLVVRRRPSARVDETALVGGLAALLAGLIFTGLSWFSTGGLGTGRLAAVGPRMLELLVMSGTLLGLSGMLYGLVVGLVRLVREVRSTRIAEGDPDEEITEAIAEAASSAEESSAAEGSARTGLMARIRSLRKRADERTGSQEEPAEEDDEPLVASSPATAERVVVNEADEPTAKVAVRRTAANTGRGSDESADAANSDDATRAELDAADPHASETDEDLTADPRAGAEPEDPEATVRVEDRRTA